MLSAPLQIATKSLAVNRYAIRPDVDMDAGRRVPVLIKLIAKHADDDDQRPNHQIEEIIADHGPPVTALTGNARSPGAGFRSALS